MGKKLIITEKPSVARDFARVLKVSGNGKGCIENSEYVISWCYGHLVSMVYPEEYDIKYKSWNLEDLPFLPKEYKYGVVQSAKDQYYVVNSLLHRDDIDTVYWAGDSGKEGQTIEENIRHFGGVRQGMTELRVWIDSQTDDEILRGIKEAKPMSDYALLGKSGVMRTIEDYALGINFSRALSVKYGRMINDAAATTSYTAISIGRVMTCVLGMVVQREREIRNFDETPFFKISGDFSDINFKGEWKATEKSKYFESPLLYGDAGNGFKKREDASKLIGELAGKPASIIDKDISVSKKKAPLLFNLAELQSECSKRFKISPAQTLEIIQDLYEKKYTTYPRTDARVLTSAVAKEINKNIYKLQAYGPTAAFVKDILENKKFIGLEKTSYTDDSKVTDHYAIIPTGQCNGIDKLPALSQSVYQLIVRRFLSIFYPPAEYKTAKLTIGVENESFFSSAKQLIKPGYLEIAGIPKPKKGENGEDDEEDNSFSKEKFIELVEAASKGDPVTVNGFTLKEGKTSPPKRYTSGNLILAMENAGKLIEDEELREQIKTTGIGTSATRGEIIDKLIRIGYLNLNNKTQIITPQNLGEMIYEVVLLTTPSLLNPSMTAKWEQGLEGIINGSVDDNEYRSQLEDYIRTETKKMIDVDLTSQIAGNINQFTGKGSKGIATRRPIGLNCPVCGGELTTTSFGYGCSNYFNDEIKCKFNFGQVAGLLISEDDFKDLITKGKTKVIGGFKGKNSKRPFSAILKLEKDDLGQFHTSFDFSETTYEPEKLEGCHCPECGGDIVIRKMGYSCSNYNPEDETSCRFMLWNTISSKTINDATAKELLTNGKSSTIRGFKSKSGKKFDACLVLKKNEENGKVEVGFDFDAVEAKKVKGAKCPVCGGDIVVTSFGYGCSNYDRDNPDASCRFNIGQIAGLKLKEASIKELLSNGITSTITGFKSKKGSKFDAKLALSKDENGKVSGVKFVFENTDKEMEGVNCPKCGGAIIKAFNGYRCKNNIRDNADSCPFFVGKVAGVTIDEDQFKKLITDKKTDIIEGFLSKKGLYFNARLKLDDECKVIFDFDQFQ